MNPISTAVDMRGFEPLGRWKVYGGMVVFSGTSASATIPLPSGVTNIRFGGYIWLNAPATDETLYINSSGTTGATLDTTNGILVVAGAPGSRTLTLGRTGASPTSGLSALMFFFAY